MDVDVVAKLDDFIRKKGMRRTPQRDAIVEIAFSSDDHFTAEELFERVRRNNIKASRATVYRTIALLEEARLLREIDLGGDIKTYDPNFLDKPSHNHLICIDCGDVFEFESEHIEILNETLTRRMGFRPMTQAIKIEACCEQLRRKGTCSHLIAARLKKKRLPVRRK